MSLCESASTEAFHEFSSLSKKFGKQKFPIADGEDHYLVAHFAGVVLVYKQISFLRHL
jgi:hypothetical protein